MNLRDDNMDFKREYENYGKRLANNKKKIKELHELKQQINDEISKLEEESRLLLDRKLNIGLKICQMEGHVGNW